MAGMYDSSSKLQDDCSDLYLELDVLVSDADGLTVRMGVWFPPVPGRTELWREGLVH